MRANIARQVEAVLAAAGIMITTADRIALDARLAAGELGLEPEDLGQPRSQSVVTLDASEKAKAEAEALDEKRESVTLTDEEKAACYDKARSRKARDKKAKDSRTFDQAYDAAFGRDNYKARVIRSEFGFLGPVMSHSPSDLDAMFAAARSVDSSGPVVARDGKPDLHDFEAIFSPSPTQAVDLDALFGLKPRH
jgi:hypothetical protein